MSAGTDSAAEPYAARGSGDPGERKTEENAWSN